MKRKGSSPEETKLCISSEEHKKRISAIKRIAALATVFMILTVGGTIAVNRVIGGDSGFSDIVKGVDEHPFITALVLMAVNFTQVVIAFIPGEIVEQACGVLGPYIGTLICLISTVTGSCFVIFIVRKFGRNLVYAVYPKEKIDKISFLNDPKKRNALTFLLFFIPGTPKDALTYAIGITDMSIPTYIALTTAARLPSIVMSTVSGDMIAALAMGKGDIWAIIVLNSISLAICGVGYLAYILINRAVAKRSDAKPLNTSDDKKH